MRPDFDYNVEVKEGLEFWVLEIDPENRLAIRRNFTIEKRTRKRLIINDGYSRITVNYNNEFLEFLQEIKE